jgi:hypothetical protein
MFDVAGPETAMAYGRGLGFSIEELTSAIAQWTAEAAAE